MKRILFLVIFLLNINSAFGFGIVDNKTTGFTSEDSLTFHFPNLDSLGQPLGGLDTTKIIVVRNGDSTFAEVIDGVVGRITSRSTGNGKYDTSYYYTARIADIDGDGTLGNYTIRLLTVSNESGAYIRGEISDEFQVVTSPLSASLDSAVYAQKNNDSLGKIIDSLEQATLQRDEIIDSINVALDSIFAILDTVTNLNTWVATIANQNLTLDSVFAILDSVSLYLDIAVSSRSTLTDSEVWAFANRTLTALGFVLTKTDIPYLAYFDTLAYNGGDGLGVWINENSGNTNTVVGVDGTKKNPVDNLTSARTIADALGATRYYITGGTDLGTGGDSLSATHTDWEFIGEGTFNSIALGGSNVDRSEFINLTVKGQQGNGTAGQYAKYRDCFLTMVSNVKSYIFDCTLLDSILLRTNVDTWIINCQSGIAGNGTPILQYGGGAVNVSIRKYSGGLSIQNMGDNDLLSFESDGQIIIGANCISAPITLRGNMTIIDSGTTTALSRDAALNGSYISQLDSALIKTMFINNWTSALGGLGWAVMLGDSTWLRPFPVSGGTYADSANVWGATAASGGVSDAEMASIIDTLFNRLVSDTITNTYLSVLLEFSSLAGDTSLWANVEDVWRNIDTLTTVDSSAIGQWLKNNLSGTSGLSATEIMDSLRANGEEITFVPTDTNKTGQTLSIFQFGTDQVIVATNNDKNGYALIIQDWTTDADLIPLQDSINVLIDSMNVLTVSIYAMKDTIDLYLDVPISTRSTFNSLIDSILLANKAELSKEFADSVWLYILTGSLPNQSAGKDLRDLSTNVVRVALSRGMAGSSANMVMLDLSASTISGSYDPSMITNVETGETGYIIEYDEINQVAILFRDLKTPFLNGDEFKISSWGGFTVVNDGRVRGSTSNTFTLNPLASSVDNVYSNQTALISSGNGSDEANKIKSYNGTTKIATMYEAWNDIPDDSSTYVIIPIGDGFETRFMDSLVSNPIPVVSSDTTTTGDTLAVKKDSLIYQGVSGGGSDTTSIKQLFINNWTSASGGLGWAVMLGDSTWLNSIRTLTQEFVINDTNILGEIIGLMPDNWTAADSAAFQGAASGLSLQDIALIVDSILTANHGIGPWTTGGTGSGPNTVFIYTIDTSATPDDTLTGIPVYVNNLSGSLQASGVTNSLGYTTVGLTFDTWELLAGTNMTNYSFDNINFTNSTNPDTVSILGYLNVIPNPTDPLKGFIFGFAKDVLGLPTSDIMVILSLESAMNITSTGPGGYVVGLGIDTTYTDSVGYFQFEVPRSSTFFDSTKSLYNILGQLNKYPQFVVDSINVPDTGNVDITDVINNP